MFQIIVHSIYYLLLCFIFNDVISELGAHDQISVQQKGTSRSPDAEEASFVFDDGTKMIDSVAICLHLAEAYGELLPDKDETANYYR